MIKYKNTIGIALIALIIGVGIGYSGERMFNRSVALQGLDARSGFAGTYGGATGGMMRGGVRGGAGSNGGFLTGTVAAKDAGSITLNTRDGSSHVVFITPSTNVSKSVSGAVSDVSVGTTVIVSGTTNSDGSVSATLLQLRPGTQTTPQAQ